MGRITSNVYLTKLLWSWRDKNDDDVNIIQHYDTTDLHTTYYVTCLAPHYEESLYCHYPMPSRFYAQSLFLSPPCHFFNSTQKWWLLDAFNYWANSGVGRPVPVFVLRDLVAGWPQVLGGPGEPGRWGGHQPWTRAVEAVPDPPPPWVLLRPGSCRPRPPGARPGPRAGAGAGARAVCQNLFVELHYWRANRASVHKNMFIVLPKLKENVNQFYFNKWPKQGKKLVLFAQQAN